MKIVNLIGPAVIAGAVRYPVEGPLTVADAEAEQLKESGRLDGDAEDLPSPNEEGDEPDEDLDGMKVADLKALAEADGIDLGNATTKADIIAAIRAHRMSVGE